MRRQETRIHIHIQYPVCTIRKHAHGKFVLQLYIKNMLITDSNTKAQQVQLLHISCDISFYKLFVESYSNFNLKYIALKSIYGLKPL